MHASGASLINRSTRCHWWTMSCDCLDTDSVDPSHPTATPFPQIFLAYKAVSAQASLCFKNFGADILFNNLFLLVMNKHSLQNKTKSLAVLMWLVHFVL